MLIILIVVNGHISLLTTLLLVQIPTTHKHTTINIHTPSPPTKSFPTKSP